MEARAVGSAVPARDGVSSSFLFLAAWIEGAGRAQHRFVGFSERLRSGGTALFSTAQLSKTLVQLGQKVCQTREEFKAWSQNLGHEQVLATFASYGAVASYRQAEIIGALPSVSLPESDLLGLMQKAMKAAKRHVASRK
jgi:hypothetical protein